MVADHQGGQCDGGIGPRLTCSNLSDLIVAPDKIAKIAMDPVTNPFAPGAGSQPPELAGRDEILAKTKTTLARVQIGRPAKSFMLVGLRGVGKTVLLNKVEEIANRAVT